jgi:sulfur dioxygenase
MLLRQFFNHPTFSYTYLLADPLSEEAVLIDPVKDKLRDYVQLFNELGYTLTAAIDTHYHDDYVTCLPALRELWGCETVAGAPSHMPGITKLVEDGDSIQVGSMQLKVIYTPGHTDDSYSYLIEQPGISAVFTGDTLLVRTVGLSDQTTSDPRMHYDSLMNVLSKLDDATIVYPGKDFKGWPMSTIREEKAFNPYLNTANIDEFVDKKNHQKAAWIQPIGKIVDGHDEEIKQVMSGRPADPAKAVESAAAQTAGGDFFLPQEAGPASDPASATSIHAQPISTEKPNKESASGDDDDTDPSTVPSWR